MSVSMALAGANTRVFWGPKDLGSTLLGWWDASVTASLTTSGSSVIQWDDQSGNGYHASQGTGANQPSVSGSTITFATNDYLTTTLSASSTDRFAAVVGKMTESAVDTLLGCENNGGIQFRGNNGSTQLNKAGQVFIGAGPNYSKTAQQIFTLHITSTAYLIGVNGTESGGSHSQTFTSGRVTWFGGRKDGGGTLGEFLDGSMNEVIIADSQTLANRQRVEGYLAHRWGLTGNLPSTHPYKSVAP